jgi:aminopeptidase N
MINGVNFKDQILFIQTDDSNSQDSTVMVIKLPYKVKPGESVNMYFKFLDQLPKVFARTGYYENFFMVGQWFPKIAVLEEEGWNCHQFHANSEFYADFGVYDVNISVPKNFIVGASGIPIDTAQNGKETTYTFRAEDVHDFAWTASPNYKKATRTIHGVEVELLYQPEHESSVERYFEAMDHALQYFGEWYIPYPYPKITVVDPPMLAFGAGGMEYPTLITGGTVYKIPSNIRFVPEGVTIHEFGHQYFYGILASNEFEEAWLDEGMNTYSTSKIMTKVYGEWTSSANFFGIQSGDFPSAHFSYIQLKRRGVIYQKAWTYPPNGYSFNSYGKPSIVLYTLEKYLGSDTMSQIWKEYFRRFAFKHPKTEDFIQTAMEVSGKDLRWFFNQFVYGDAVVDYRVLHVRYTLDHKDTSGTRYYRNTVWISREEDGKIPVEVQFIFSNGDTLMKTWDGQAVAKKFEFLVPAKITEVQIDPERKIYIDINWTNNSWRKKQKFSWVYYLRNRSLFFLQNIFMMLTN